MDQLAERLATEGLVTLREGRLALTLRGRLIADAIGTEVMTAMETDISA